MQDYHSGISMSRKKSEAGINIAILSRISLLSVGNATGRICWGYILYILGGKNNLPIVSSYFPIVSTPSTGMDKRETVYRRNFPPRIRRWKLLLNLHGNHKRQILSGMIRKNLSRSNVLPRSRRNLRSVNLRT